MISPDEADFYDAKEARYTLSVVRIGGAVRCVYLNNSRIVGGKPYVSENGVSSDFQFTLRDLQRAFPQLEINQRSPATCKDTLQVDLAAALESVPRKSIYDHAGNWIASEVDWPAVAVAAKLVQST